VADHRMNFLVKLNDFGRRWEDICQEVLGAVERVGESGYYILGQEVQGFEENLARFWGTAHAIGVGSGLDAIEIALQAVGVGPGCRVLTTPLSAFATTLAVLRCGAEPVFSDVDETGSIDLERCADALSHDRRISVLVPVHLYGHAVNLDRLVALTKEYGVTVVEDCAQSIGARSCGKPVGTVGPVAATSFYPTKNLGALGDAGAVLTADSKVADAARSLRNYGQRTTYVHDLLGLNSRLDELQAGILSSVFLPRLPAWTENRRAVARRYRAEIRNPSLALPEVPQGSESVWHLFPILVEPGGREDFRAHMTSLGVQTGVHYPCLIPDQKAMTDRGEVHIFGELSVASRFARDEVSLPIHPYLGDSEIDRVVSACNQWSPR
jgi:dTDP-4-amino-4,6-dideoxygalactose transaminase